MYCAFLILKVLLLYLTRAIIVLNTVSPLDKYTDMDILEA